MPRSNQLHLRATMERKRYHKIITANELNLKKIKAGKQPNIKINLILLSCHFKFLNLSAKRGISATKRKQKSSIKRNKKTALNFSEIKKPRFPKIKELQKRALAGVGNPMKEEV